MLFFLDIDGVMVPAKGWKAPELLGDGFPVFSNKATHALQTLLSEKDTVVLTTSHKARFSIEEWKNIFQNRDIKIENILSLPENFNNHSRKDEIVNWFKVNNINEGFVIIDDDKSLNELPDFLKPNLVQTSPYIGLTEAHIQDVNAILYKGLQPIV
jgi:hypothetical protein